MAVSLAAIASLFEMAATNGDLVAFNNSLPAKLEFVDAGQFGAQVNNYNVRELNPFSAPTSVNNNEQKAISDRPGLIIAFSNDFSKYALVGLILNGAHILGTNDVAFFTNVPGTASAWNFEFAGREWFVENKHGSTQNIYLCVTSMGDQLP